jgi:hypothetical protein
MDFQHDTNVELSLDSFRSILLHVPFVSRQCIKHGLGASQGFN